MILKFIMLSGEKDGFLREYEVPQDMNLIDFHNFLSGSLNYDETAMVSFFSADPGWNKLREFTLVNMDAGDGEESPLPMSEVSVGQAAPQKNDRLLYVFDMFGDRAMFLEMVGALKPEHGVMYPRVATAHGEPPVQFDAADFGGDDIEGLSVFDEALGEFGSFEGDDFYEDEF